MSDEMERDDRLATLTDVLRGGGQVDTAGDEGMHDLMMVVQRLHRLIPPNQEAPSSFRAELARMLATEYEQQQRQRQPIPLMQRSWVRLASAAAALVLIISVVVVLQDNSTPSEGTASGDGGLAVLVLGALFFVMVGGFATYYYLRRPRS